MASQRHRAPAQVQRTTLATGAKAGAASKPDVKGRGEEFLSAALDLFAERNFASVTIKDIGQALDVNTSLIYYYFESKTDLFKATIDFAVENAFANMLALEASDAPPEGLLAAWLNSHVERYAEIHRFVKIALDYRSSHEGDAGIEATIARFYGKERELLARIVRRGVEQKDFLTVDPDRMAQYISTYLDGCMVRSVIVPDFDLETAVSDLHRSILTLVGYKAKSKTRRRRG